MISFDLDLPSQSSQYSGAYAHGDLEAAWLLQEMVREPGDFGQVEMIEPVDALQHALFMAGYARLPDSAISAA